MLPRPVRTECSFRFVLPSSRQRSSSGSNGAAETRIRSTPRSGKSGSPTFRMHDLLEARHRPLPPLRTASASAATTSGPPSSGPKTFGLNPNEFLASAEAEFSRPSRPQRRPVLTLRSFSSDCGLRTAGPTKPRASQGLQSSDVLKDQARAPSPSPIRMSPASGQPSCSRSSVLRRHSYSSDSSDPGVIAFAHLRVRPILEASQESADHDRTGTAASPTAKPQHRAPPPLPSPSFTRTPPRPVRSPSIATTPEESEHALPPSPLCRFRLCTCSPEYEDEDTTSSDEEEEELRG